MNSQHSTTVKTQSGHTSGSLSLMGGEAAMFDSGMVSLSTGESNGDNLRDSILIQGEQAKLSAGVTFAGGAGSTDGGSVALTSGAGNLASGDLNFGSHIS